MAQETSGSKGKKRKVSEDLPVDEMSLEACFAELQRIVDRLEKDELSLDESLRLFERGMQLSRRCERELQGIEQKIQLIVEDQSGEVRTKNFIPPEDEEADS